MNKQNSWENTIFPTWFAVQFLNLFHKRKRGSDGAPTPPSLRGQCSAVRWCGFIWEASRGRKRAFCGCCHTTDRCWSKLHFLTAGQSDHEKVHTSAVPLVLAALTNFAESLPELCHLLLGEVSRWCHFLLPWVAGLQRRRHLFSFGAFWVCSCDETHHRQVFIWVFKVLEQSVIAENPAPVCILKSSKGIKSCVDEIQFHVTPVVLPGPAQNYNNFIYINLTGIKSSLCWLSFLMEKTD